MSKKLVVWALFDSETGDYTTTIHKYFDDKIDVYGVGLSHYGKDTDRYVNFNLADFSELFGGEESLLNEDINEFKTIARNHQNIAVYYKPDDDKKIQDDFKDLRKEKNENKD